MVTFRGLCLFICVQIVFSFGHGVSASEPTIYSKLQEPSPLGEDRILVLCLLEQNATKSLGNFYENVRWDEFAERELSLVEISQNSVDAVHPEFTDRFSGHATRTRRYDAGNRLRQKADCKKTLEFVLLGKDTGVKARWKNDFSQDDLFKRIDAMPMRKYEMRESGLDHKIPMKEP